MHTLSCLMSAERNHLVGRVELPLLGLSVCCLAQRDPGPIDYRHVSAVTKATPVVGSTSEEE